MTSYVIKRKGDRRYAARAGSANSYTPDIRGAQIYTSREAAEVGACGNEYVVTLAGEFAGRGS